MRTTTENWEDLLDGRAGDVAHDRKGDSWHCRVVPGLHSDKTLGWIPEYDLLNSHNATKNGFYYWKDAHLIAMMTIHGPFDVDILPPVTENDLAYVLKSILGVR